MNSSYEEGLEILNKWQNEHAELWVQFWEPGETSVSGKCFISELTHETLSLQFGHIALGSLALSLPLNDVFVARDTFFTHSMTTNEPPTIRARLEPFTERLELRYRFWGIGCTLFRFKQRT